MSIRSPLARYAEDSAPSTLRRTLYAARPTRPKWRHAALGGLAAAGVATFVMMVLRWTLQVRTIPERLLEGSLLFVPPDQFVTALRLLGFNAKGFAFLGWLLVMVYFLTGLGALALRGQWSVGTIFWLGATLWLSVMAFLMPFTGAGFFAMGLVYGTTAAIGGHLAIMLMYCGTLALINSLPHWGQGQYVPAAWAEATGEWAAVQATPQAARRPALLLLGGAFVTMGASFAVGQRPTRRLAAATVPVRSSNVHSPDVGHPGAVSAGNADSPYNNPDPPPARVRQLQRDKDGAVLASGRRPGELAEFLTKNDDFYIVSKNAQGDPVLRARDWHLRIEGEVERPVELDYVNLRRLAPVEVTKTLECISNFVSRSELAPFGADLISTATWKGARMSDVLALAGGLKPSAKYVVAVCADEYTSTITAEVAVSPETLLVYEMNGNVLPREHGYPVRMLVPGRYGMKNAKWVLALRAMDHEFIDWYGQRQWTTVGVVKTMSRIDVPAAGAALTPGRQRIAGIAYAGDRGVSRVQYSADGGATWAEAVLLDAPAGTDTWVRWEGSFNMVPGSALKLVSRAYDGTGAMQTETFSLPQPDGSSGWYGIDVRATA